MKEFVSYRRALPHVNSKIKFYVTLFEEKHFTIISQKNIK